MCTRTPTHTYIHTHTFKAAAIRNEAEHCYKEVSFRSVTIRISLYMQFCFELGRLRLDKRAGAFVAPDTGGDSAGERPREMIRIYDLACLPYEYRGDYDKSFTPGEPYG